MRDLALASLHNPGIEAAYRLMRPFAAQVISVLPDSEPIRIFHGGVRSRARFGAGRPPCRAARRRPRPRRRIRPSRLRFRRPTCPRLRAACPGAVGSARQHPHHLQHPPRGDAPDTPNSPPHANPRWPARGRNPSRTRRRRLFPRRQPSTAAWHSPVLSRLLGQPRRRRTRRAHGLRRGRRQIGRPAPPRPRSSPQRRAAQPAGQRLVRNHRAAGGRSDQPAEPGTLGRCQ